MYTNDKCDRLMHKTTGFATDREYGQYFVGIPHSLTGDQILRMGSPSRLKWTIAITKSKLEDIRNTLFANGTSDAFDMAELMKLKIAREIISLSASVKEFQFGIKSSAEMTQIKIDFLKNVAEIVDDLTNHVWNVLKFDELYSQVKDSVIAISHAQRQLPMELAFSFLS